MDAELTALINRLEEMIISAPRLPVVGKIVVDGDELLTLIDRLRAAEERENERPRRGGQSAQPGGVGAKVHPTGTRVEIVRPAEALYANHEATASGESREQPSQEILARAEAQAQQMLEQAQVEADQYAADVLQRLEEQLTGLLTSVRKGIEVLETDRQHRR